MKFHFQNLLLLVVLTVQGCGQDQLPPLRIAAAANVQYAMRELAEVFEKKTGIRTDIIVGSSGKLTAQILQGAPYDIFVSADMKYPMELYKNNFARDEPVVYALGKLVLWTLRNDISLSIDSITAKNITHLAVANPEIAPYGQAAVAALRHYDKYELIKEKIVSGESIAQTNQFVLTGAAEIGFTAKSVVLAPELKGKGRWVEVDPASYPPIQQGMVVLDNPKGAVQKSQKFYEYLCSPQGQEILAGFGYETHLVK